MRFELLTENKTLALVSILVLFAILGTSIKAIGQELPEPINTGRPDLTQGTYTVPKGLVQLEAGTAFWKLTEENTELTARTYPELLARVGVLKGLELRLQSMVQDTLIKESGASRRVSGLGPLGVGFRLQLWDQKGVLPQAALQTTVTLPVGDKKLRPEHAEPEFILVLAHELNQKLELTYNLGYGWHEEEAYKSYGLNLAADLSDKVKMYLEALGEKQEGQEAEHFADLGLLYLLSNNLQVDIAAGIGLNSAAPDYFLTSGVSIRLPR